MKKGKKEKKDKERSWYVRFYMFFPSHSKQKKSLFLNLCILFDFGCDLFVVVGLVSYFEFSRAHSAICKSELCAHITSWSMGKTSECLHCLYTLRESVTKLFTIFNCILIANLYRFYYCCCVSQYKRNARVFYTRQRMKENLSNEWKARGERRKAVAAPVNGK